MEDFPKYATTELGIQPDQSPLYRAGSTEILDVARKVNAEIHQKRQRGDDTKLSLTELETSIEVYFAFCSSKKKLPTPAGLCSSIGLNHKELLTILKSPSEQAKILQDALEVIHTIYQEGVVEGTIPVKTYTFMAKNYWGMSDKEIVEIQQVDGDVKVAEIDARLNRLKLLK